MMGDGMAYLKTAQRRYLIEMVSAGMLLFAADWLRNYELHHATDPALLLAAKLLPLLPIVLIAIAVLRLYRNLDEFQRQTILKTCAMAGLMSLTILMAWPFLHDLGAPLLSRGGNIFVLAGSYIACGAVVAFLGLKAESGFKHAALRMLPFVTMLGLLAALYFIVFVLWQPPFLQLRGVAWLASAAAIFVVYRLIQRRIEP
jgi:hypothetical protein